MKSIEYKVQSGDSLPTIARRHNLTEDVLSRVNGISSLNPVKPGQVLRIPKEIQSTSQVLRQSRTEDRVRADDSLAKIAQRNNVTEEALCQANGISDSKCPPLGVVLRIPQERQSTPRSQTLKSQASKAKATSAKAQKNVSSEMRGGLEPRVRLKLKTLTFMRNHPIENDSKGEFKPPEWKLGRPALGSLPAQFPVCYVGSGEIELKAEFEVDQKPSKEEEVEIIGKAVFGKAASPGTPPVEMTWSYKLKVGPSSPSIVITPAMMASQKLPAHVACYDDFSIEWSCNTQAGSSSAGMSKNTLYLLWAEPKVLYEDLEDLKFKQEPRAKPKPVVYWTLVDVSCRFAQNTSQKKNNEDDKDIEKSFVESLYRAFEGAKVEEGAQRKLVPIRRKRDGVVLRYWDPSSDKEPERTRDFLGSPKGSARCGVWARFMINMCRVHGITARLVRIRDARFGDPNYGVRDYIGMLVKNWSFPREKGMGRSIYDKEVEFTHQFGPESFKDNHGAIFKDKELKDVRLTVPHGGCRRGSGIPAQGNPKPPAAFWDHEIVEHSGLFYDPSYGTPRRNNHLEWEVESLAGVFKVAEIKQTRTTYTTKGKEVNGKFVATGKTVTTVTREEYWSLVSGVHPGFEVFKFDPDEIEEP